MILATHNGTFHTDDVMAAAVLLQVFPKSEIIRTRDPELIKTAGVVFDVGGIYKPEDGKFDHHFKNSPTRSNGVQYSSVGMIWKTYGRDYLKSCGIHPSEIEDRWEKIDARIILGVDLQDTGYQGQKTPEIAQARARMGHAVAAISLGNTTWKEQRDEPKEKSEQLFRHTVELTAMQLRKYALDLNPGHFRGEFDGNPFFKKRAKLHEQSVAEAETEIMSLVKTSGEIMTLPAVMPWDRIVTPENAKQLKYVLFPSDGVWRCQTVPTERKGFTPKEALPEAWRGKTGAALQKLTGVADATFCHPGGFIMGAKSKEGVEKLTALAQTIAKQRQDIQL
jgi:uncharacterized UPF0160 family protein